MLYVVVVVGVLPAIAANVFVVFAGYARTISRRAKIYAQMLSILVDSYHSSRCDSRNRTLFLYIVLN